MRAAQAAPRPARAAWRPGVSLHRPAHSEAAPALRNKGNAGVMLGLAAAFFAGYLPGLLAGRSGQLAVGQALAAYYMEQANFAAWAPVYTAQLSTAFLQATLVLLCGFCVFGGGFLAVLFAARGAYLGLCAASVYAAGGAKSLVIYWLLTCLPDMAVLFCTLWLAGHAAKLGGDLFACVFAGGAPRGQLIAGTRRILLRYGVVLLLLAVICAASAGLAVLFAGILL